MGGLFMKALQVELKKTARTLIKNPNVIAPHFLMVFGDEFLINFFPSPN
jgi:hypothetical protein